MCLTRSTGRLGGSMADPGIDAAPLSTEAVGRQMAALFGQATASAAPAAHTEGLAISGRVGGRVVEQRPDGPVHDIDETACWFPTGWKARSSGSL